MEEYGNYVFVGVRQAGKSYLLYQRVQQLLAEGKLLEEVDFYVSDEGLAVQASYRMSNEATWEREIKALVALNSLYPLRKAMIVTYEDEGIVERDGLKIEIVPVWKWVLNGETQKQ